MSELSITQQVIHLLAEAGQPLTVAEIQARIEQSQPLTGGKLRATIRDAVDNSHLIATLGGRPARYTWWPRHLAENRFRQPLAGSDLATGTLALTRELRLALWPDFPADSSGRAGEMTLALAGGPLLRIHIDPLLRGRPLEDSSSKLRLADWLAQQGATVEDELLVQVLDANEHHYAVSLARRADRDEPAIGKRNQLLANTVEKVVRTGQPNMPDLYLIPRLIAREIYRHPVPPDPLDQVLRADLRFVVPEQWVSLTEKTLTSLEKEPAVAPGPHTSPRPPGDRSQAHSETDRQAWAAYLFDRGLDHLWAGWTFLTEVYYREALRLDPGHADAWVHLGYRRFREGRVTEALTHYERGQAAAEARTIGEPEQYQGSFWDDVDSRPFMRALHGRGLCLWRLGRTAEARQIFTQMLTLNPDDNQGVRFLLTDLEQGLSWEESVGEDEQDSL